MTSRSRRGLIPLFPALRIFPYLIIWKGSASRSDDRVIKLKRPHVLVRFPARHYLMLGDWSDRNNPTVVA
jgi:hypothetical protein